MVIVIVVGALVVTGVGLAQKQRIAAESGAKSWLLDEAAIAIAYEVLQEISLVHATYSKCVTQADDLEDFVGLLRNGFDNMTVEGGLLQAKLVLETEYPQAKKAATAYLSLIEQCIGDQKIGRAAALQVAEEAALEAMQSLRAAAERKASHSRDLLKDTYAMFIRATELSAVVVIVSVLVALTMIILARRMERGWSEYEEYSHGHMSWMLASVGHDIRSPLQTILSVNKLLEKAEDPTERQEYCRNIQDASRRIVNLVGDLYWLANMGALKISTDVIDIGQTIYRSLAGARMDASTKNLQWHCDLGNCAGLIVSCDKTRLLQVVDNLIGNAVKYTETGFVSIQLDWQTDPDGDSKGNFIFSVADTGVGIPADEIPRIWEPYFRSRNSTPEKGSGVGLATVLMLVERMQGKIWVQSIENRGSSFKVAMPMRLAKNAVPDEVTVPKRSKPVCESILVVDDDQDLRFAVKALLSDTGFKVVAAGDGRAAIEELKSGHFDAVVTDIQMPGINGYELAKFIKQTIRPTPLLISLSDSGMEHPELFQSCLHKPVADDVLIDAICHAIEDAGSSTDKVRS